MQKNFHSLQVPRSTTVKQDYGPCYELYYCPRYRTTQRLKPNNRYCATAPLDRQTYNAGYIHMEIGLQSEV